MQCNQDYVVDSLELHLFFARNMKEHSLFLKAGFTPPGAAFARESEMFLRRFEAILSRAISLSNHIVRRCVLDSGEAFTRFTDRAECQTQRLTGIAIDRQLTARAMCLTGFLMSLGIELAQLLNYRISDVDDLIMNTLGAFLGYELLMLLSRRKKNLLIREQADGRKMFLAILGGVVAVMFALRPYITRAVSNIMF